MYITWFIKEQTEVSKNLPENIKHTVYDITGPFKYEYKVVAIIKT